MTAHNFNDTIIRAYDIRGIYQETLFDDDAYFVGKSFATFLKGQNQNSIAVACDGRISSPSLKSQLIKGLVASGINVIDVGLGPTPMLYFSVYHLNLDAGIMVTGSHNPKNHNGFKMMLKSRPFFGDDIKHLADIAAKGDFVEGQGSVAKQDIKEEYVSRLIQDLSINKELNIAWDAGNGAAGEIMQELIKQIPGNHEQLFADIDGTFPNHHPDPTVPKNLEDIIKVVREKKCDLGIAFDGDGDRIGVVDDEGEIIWGDQLMVFYAKEVLKTNPGAVVIADVKASKVFFDEVIKAGGKAVMGKTGHSLIKSKMKETGAKIAGEMSGHIFFADKYYGFDDALYAAIRIINIVSNLDTKLSDLRKTLPQTCSTPEIRIDVAEENKFQIVEDLKEKLKEKQIDFSDVDGIRADSDLGWWLLRASNTQSCLVARCEANSVENLEKLKEILTNNLESLGVNINL
ncbi:MAG: phosphomannomutase/phosphoglucomutase [Rickettsiales bacterium]|nr:phosphomannomutase/phosphoglucomutase [Rickettsiales bacterium]